MHLTNLEKETIILYNEAESTASVYTHNAVLRRKLEGLALERADECKLERVSHEGQAVEYSVPKKWVKINAGRVLTEEQRAAAVEWGRKLADLRRNNNNNCCSGDKLIEVGSYTSEGVSLSNNGLLAGETGQFRG